MTATEQATHTPGPWNAVGNGTGSHWDIHQKTDTIDGGFFCRVDALHFTEEARAIAKASARLIAASPDLLAACESAMEFFGELDPIMFDGRDDLPQLVRDAVTKAKS